MEQLTLGEYLEQLGSADPAPGGGSAGAVAAALGSSLGMMALRLARRKAEGEALKRVEGLLRDLDELGRKFLDLAEADGRAYQEYSRVRKRLKAGEAASGEMEEAARVAVQIPLQLGERSVETLDLLAQSLGLVSSGVASDVVAGGRLLRAALQGSWANVEANIGQLASENEVQEARKQMQAQERAAGRSLKQLGLLD